MAEQFLYNDGKIRIVYNPKSHGDYIVYFGNEEDVVHIPRGVLKELGETYGLEKIAYKINTFNPNIRYILSDHELTMNDLALAIAQARIQEESKMVSHLLAIEREYRERLEELGEARSDSVNLKGDR